jgi:hypothetical protein
VDWEPSFLWTFITIFIFAGFVEDRDADSAIRVDYGNVRKMGRECLTVRMPHFADEFEGWWHERILLSKRKSCLEKSSFAIQKFKHPNNKIIS